MTSIISKRRMTMDKLTPADERNMNEDIREFAEQAYGSAHYDDFEFAKLIIRDCISICERGDSTQTTSAGAASQIRQKYNIFD